jgi:hypothetical protein
MRETLLLLIDSGACPSPLEFGRPNITVIQPLVLPQASGGVFSASNWPVKPSAVFQPWMGGRDRKSPHDGFTRPSLANFLHPAWVVRNNGTNVTACEKSSVVCLFSKFPKMP